MKFPFAETVYLVTFTEEIVNGKLHVLCSSTGGIKEKIILTPEPFNVLRSNFAPVPKMSGKTFLI